MYKSINEAINQMCFHNNYAVLKLWGGGGGGGSRPSYNNCHKIMGGLEPPEPPPPPPPFLHLCVACMGRSISSISVQSIQNSDNCLIANYMLLTVATTFGKKSILEKAQCRATTIKQLSQTSEILV